MGESNLGRRCQRCGHSETVAGSLQSTGAVRFRPDGVKFMTFHTADVAVRATMCTSCGSVEFIGDIEKLRLVSSSLGLEVSERPVAGARDK